MCFEYQKESVTHRINGSQVVGLNFHFMIMTIKLQQNDKVSSDWNVSVNVDIKFLLIRLCSYRLLETKQLKIERSTTSHNITLSQYICILNFKVTIIK